MVLKANFSIVSVSIMAGLVLASCAPREEVIPLRANIRSMMSHVPAGTAWRATPAWNFGRQFAPNGDDLLNLMEIQGASYIVKAPASAAGGCHIDCDVRYFAEGKEWPQETPVTKGESWQSSSPATMWLVDILAWPDWVSSSGFVYRVRIRPLDGEPNWLISFSGFFKPPGQDSGAATWRAWASLYQTAQPQVGLDKPVPLACLSIGPMDKSYKPSPICGADDPERLARASRQGIVFYIRLGHKTATTTTLPTTLPAPPGATQPAGR